MAVRFSADGQSYTRATTLGAVTDWTAAGWVKLALDRAAMSVVWQIDDGAGASRLRMVAWNGTALAFQTDPGGWYRVMGHTLAVDQWTYVGLSATASPGQVRVRIRPAGDMTFTGFTPSEVSAAFNASTIRVGDGLAANEWLNGSVAGFRFWDAALSMDELEAESWAYLPVRTESLRAWYPFLRPEVTDLSGNGQTLSGGTGAVLDDGPPIRWSAGRRRIVSFTGSVQGEATAALPAFTATASGAVVVAGQQSAVLPSLAAALDAAATVAGQPAAVLPALTAAASSAVGAPGLLDARLPALTGQLDGTLTGGFLIADLPALTGSVAGQLTAHSALAGNLPALTASITGDVEIPHNDITITVGTPRRGWASRSPVTDWTADATATRWQARGPTTTWTPAAPARRWTARQPTT